MARILVIDDEASIRKLLKKMLERAGHEVAEAHNGDVGIKKYRKELFDIVITNIIMPVKDGLETILELTKDFSDIRIIAISGGGAMGYDKYLTLAKRFGARHTFMKPVDRQELLNAVSELLV